MYNVLKAGLRKQRGKREKKPEEEKRCDTFSTEKARKRGLGQE